MKTIASTRIKTAHRAALVCSLAVTCLLAIPVRSQTSSQPEPINITVLYLNDVREFTPIEGGRIGSLARVSTMRQQIMTQSPNTVFVLAGNTLAPSALSTIFAGKQMIEAWNAARLDVAGIGSSDFEVGSEQLKRRIAESRFRWLGTNILENGRPLPGTGPYEVLEFSGIKIGFFSLVTDRFTKPSNVRILEPKQTAIEAVKRLRSLGATVVIALSSMSLEEDLRVVSETEGIDVLLGSQANSVTQFVGGRTPILKTSGSARELGFLNLNVDPQTKKLLSIDNRMLPVTSAIPDDPQLSQVSKNYFGDLMRLPLGWTRVELDATRQNNNSRETNVGNFVADALRLYGEADVAIINGGTIGGDRIWPPGKLTMVDLISLLPSGGELMKVRVSGTVLQQLLEYGVSETGPTAVKAGIFPQVSGISFTYNPNRPTYSRVQNILVNGKPLNKSQSYSLATVSTITSAGGAYHGLRGLPSLLPKGKNIWVINVLRNVFARTDDVAPRIENRIRLTTTN